MHIAVFCALFFALWDDILLRFINNAKKTSAKDGSDKKKRMMFLEVKHEIIDKRDQVYDSDNP